MLRNGISSAIAKPSSSAATRFATIVIDHAPAVRAQERKEPSVDGHLPPFGVSSASGRITSSGVTPPWRNDPR